MGGHDPVPALATVLLAGAAGNALVIATWIASRTTGIPVVRGPGVPEPVTIMDLVATAFEVALVAGIVARLRGAAAAAGPRRRHPLAVGAAVIAFSAWGIADHAGGGHVHGAAGLAGSHHHSAGAIPEDDPVLLDLQAAVRDGGAAGGLDLLETKVAANPSLSGLSHQYVHAVGRYVYVVAPSAAEAFSSCDDRFEGGCYHGVLQGYFEAHPDFDGGDIAGLCGELGAGSGLALEWQCLHGLGHGLSLFHDHDLNRALELCDALGSGWDRQSCYGGVFMENVIWGQNVRSGQVASPGAAVISDDPQYPCNALAERYVPSCWQMQTSTILDLVDWDLEAAFAQCDRAGFYASACLESMGRDIAGSTLHDVARSAERCAVAANDPEGWCFAGAAKQFVDFHAEAGPAFELCAAAPADSPACRTAVGQMVSFYWRDDPVRVSAECAKAGEPDRVEACEAAAGV